MSQTKTVLFLCAALVSLSACSNPGFLVDNTKVGVLSSRPVFADHEGSAEGNVRGVGPNSGAAGGNLPGYGRNGGSASGDLPGGNAGPASGSVPGGNTGPASGSLPGGNSGPTTGSIPGGNAGPTTGSIPGGTSGPTTGSIPGGTSGPTTGSIPGGTSGPTTGSFPGGNSWPTTGSIPGGNSSTTTGSIPSGPTGPTGGYVPNGSTNPTGGYIPSGSSFPTSGSVPTTSSLPKGSNVPKPAGTDGYVPPKNSNLPNPGPNEIPFSFMCSSNQMDRSNKVALAGADYLELSLTDLGTHTVCVYKNPSLLSDLKNKKVIDFAKVYADCAAQSPSFNTTNVKQLHLTGGVGSARATLDDTEGAGPHVVAKVGDRFKVIALDQANGDPSKWSSYESIMTDQRSVTSGQAHPGTGTWYVEVPYVFFDGRLQFSDDFAYTDGSACDYELSPLIVRLSDASEPISLTAPWFGRLFDILGLNSFPQAYTPKKISWFMRSADYFIVLPDQNGRVNGIDQLFGNNTSGPDGKFAANGYAALAKYDGMLFNGTIQQSLADGVIDRRDPVFAALRFWRDDNLDAVAQPHELHTLDELGVTEIDLHFDPNYSERDRWGNETRMKSTVKTSDGKLHLMYDLWFSNAAVR